MKKHNTAVGELIAKYSDDYSSGQHSVFVFSYCSRTKQARSIVKGVASGLTSLKNIGWVHASDFTLDGADNSRSDIIEKYYVLAYEKLLSSEDAKGLSELPPNGYGLWKYSEELEERGVFPK